TWAHAADTLASSAAVASKQAGKYFGPAFIASPHGFFLTAAQPVEGCRSRRQPSYPPLARRRLCARVHTAVNFLAKVRTLPCSSRARKFLRRARQQSGREAATAARGAAR